MHSIISKRKSIVCFESKSVEPEKLRLIFEAARWAPSSMNQQPWNFIVGEKGSSAHSKILKSLFPGNELWASKAPVLIVSVAKMKIEKDNSANKYAWHDTAMAFSNLVFQAVDIGLMAHPMGGFNTEYIKAEFRIPENYEPVIAIALGYDGDCTGEPQEVIDRSKRERTRKSVESFVYGEIWENSFF